MAKKRRDDRTIEYTCRACKDVYRYDTFRDGTNDRPLTMLANRRGLCVDCYLELENDIVDTKSVFYHDCGGGRRVIRSGKEMT